MMSKPCLPEEELAIFFGFLRIGSIHASEVLWPSPTALSWPIAKKKLCVMVWCGVVSVHGAKFHTCNN